MTTTAKLNVQHDYITLRIKFSDGQTLNVTRNRWGMKLSGSQATRPALDFLDAWWDRRKDATVGVTMDALLAAAKDSLTMKDFIRGL